jgi:T-complex protein 1 subunit gamma
VLAVAETKAEGRVEIDTKRYARVEKIPGGDISDSHVLRGVMVNKDIIHAKMPRKIKNPRVVLLDAPLEYVKNESATNIEVTKEEHWEALLRIEEEAVQRMCAEVLALKPTVVCTEKGVSDLAAHIFMKNGVAVLRRLRKTDQVRIARVTGATIANRTEELQAHDVGTKCGLFEVRKIGDEYFAFFEDCVDPKACTILLRGPSKDFLNEVERNLHDAMLVARNVALNPRLCVGGGAFEMAISQHLLRQAKTIEGVSQYAYQAVALALEVIPRTLAQNCGANVVRVVTELRAKHAAGVEQSSNNNSSSQGGDNVVVWGIDGEAGTVCDMKAKGIWEPYVVKVQTLKTAIEAAALLLRIDDIVSGVKKPGQQKGPDQKQQEAQEEQAGGEEK